MPEFVSIVSNTQRADAKQAKHLTIEYFRGNKLTSLMPMTCPINNFLLETYMKRALVKSITIATLISSLGASAAQAADWIEAVNIEKGGIDLQPINILSNGTNYTNAVLATHDFTFDIYARANSGKRIWYAEISSDAIEPWAHSPTEPAVNQSDPHEIHNFAGRDVNAGTLRTWDRDVTFRIPLTRIVWNGPNPSEACNELLAEKLIEGQPRAAILSQVQNTQADAKFFLRAAAARRNKAENLGGDSRTVFDTVSSHWTDEGAGTLYSVNVRCLPSPNQENQVQPQQPNPEPNENVANQPAPNSNGGLLKILPIVIGLGLVIAAGNSNSGSTTGR